MDKKKVTFADIAKYTTFQKLQFLAILTIPILSHWRIRKKSQKR